MTRHQNPPGLVGMEASEEVLERYTPQLPPADWREIESFVRGVARAVRTTPAKGGSSPRDRVCGRSKISTSACGH